MEFNDVLYSRRSTRSFTDKKVTRAQIDTLLDAAVHAPSACNMQSWHFFAITDRALLDRLGESQAFARWAASAPVVFMICTDGEALTKRFGERAERLFVLQDTAAATENLLLCAANLGLGGCWMGMFNEDVCREISGIPEKYRIVAIVPVGEPSQTTPPRERRPLSEVVTYLGGDNVKDESEDEISSETGAEKDARFKLNGESLPDAVFDDLNLEKASFTNSNMHEVSFDDINMSKASFNNINLSKTAFTDINMSETTYGGLTMSGARFGCVDMDHTVFENPQFEEAVFKNCAFKKASFIDCDFEDASFTGCKNLKN